MTRVLIHSNAPWVPSGYGKQAGHLGRTLRALGHEVTFSAFSGLGGAPVVWEGFQVLPGGMFEYGVDVLIPHAETAGAEVVITLMDLWKLAPIAEQLRGLNVAAWLPVDCTPLSKLDEQILQRAEITPIAMSDFGRQQLAQAGMKPLYAPHMVDREIFRPLEGNDRKEYRDALGLDGKFAIGIFAANNDSIRKGFPEQLEAFRRFHETREDTTLYLHSVAQASRGLNLVRLAFDLGLTEGALNIMDSYPQVTGLFDDTLLADRYGVLDLVSGCSYAEAFGVPLVEAQACGTPVVATEGSAMEENSDAGWTVQGTPFWNHVHGAWWVRPDIDQIVAAYEDAYEQWHDDALADVREEALSFAAQFDVQTVGPQFWKPIMDELCG